MKILVQYPELDACAFYRTVGPYGHLAKTYSDKVEVSFSQNPNYGEIRASDILVMQRPFTTELIFIAKHAKDYGVPLVVDFDDDFFSIPRDNPVHHLYSQESLDNVKMALQMADLVTVSTKHLRREYLKHAANVVVIPNALDPALIKFRGERPRRNRVLWRGTRTHDRDVASCATEIVQAAVKFPETEFVFLGADPCAWEVSERIKNCQRVLNPMDPFMFFQAEMELCPKILIAPLSDNNFNRSKSNIAGIEAALAGAVCLAPDWEEWRMLEGAYFYKTAKEFGSMLNHLLTYSEQEIIGSANRTFNWICDNLTLNQTNELRLKALEGLL